MALYAQGDLRRSLLITAAVGSLLILINFGPVLVARAGALHPPAWQLALNYIVPFAVASLSAVWANRQRKCPADAHPWG